MALKAQLLLILDSILQVPGLFIVDYWWKYDFYKSLPLSLDPSDIINSIITNITLVFGFTLLFISTTHLRIIYLHLLSGVLIFTAHLVSVQYIQLEMKDVSLYSFKLHLSVIAVQGFIGFTVSFLLQRPKYLSIFLFSSYSLLPMARLINMHVSILAYINMLCNFCVLFGIYSYLFRHLPTVVKEVSQICKMLSPQVIYLNWGTLLSIALTKFMKSRNFFIFWVISFVVELYEVMSYFENSAVFSSTKHFYVLILTVLSSICSSPISLFSTAIAVSYISSTILWLTRAFLTRTLFPPSPGNLMHSGWGEGFAFVIFAIRTNLIDAKMPAKVAVMTVLLFIILSSLLQSVFEITEPLVLSLSATWNKNKFQQFQAIGFCLLLLLFPLYLIFNLCKVFPVDFWMIIVLSNCWLTSVHTVVLLIVYGLFIYDNVIEEPWEKLDDTVYYIRAIARVLEFLIAVCVVGAGLWELVMQSWSWSSISIIVIHCYFNVWQRFEAGWKSFLLRRQAADRMKLLPSAPKEVLIEYNDVCAICYTDMKSACVTACKHLFHRSCIRKWLYIQETCPMCQSKINLVPPDDAASSTSN